MASHIPKAVARWLPQIVVRHPRWAAAIALLLVLFGIYIWPLLGTHPEQDACSFGPVSNERYRELLAEAKRRQTTTWPRDFEPDNNKIEMILNQRFNNLSGGMTSAYERLAAMHAVMRALGGDYRRTGFGSHDPNPKMVQGGAVGAYDYHIDLNRLYFFHPFRRQLRVFGYLLVENPSVTQYRGKFHVLYPHLLENYNTIPRSLFGEVCPVVPDEALAERLRP